MPKGSPGLNGLGLSNRTRNALESNGVTNIGQLLTLTRGDMLPWWGMGPKTIDEILDVQQKLRDPLSPVRADLVTAIERLEHALSVLREQLDQLSE
jgi:DNA-directed RNA polymerase alpha subunit